MGRPRAKRKLVGLGTTQRVVVGGTAPWEEQTTAGRHLWTLVVSFRLTDLEAAGVGEPTLNAAKVVNTAGPGCMACEQPWSAELAARPCPGQPPGRLEYVRPVEPA